MTTPKLINTGQNSFNKKRKQENYQIIKKMKDTFVFVFEKCFKQKNLSSSFFGFVKNKVIKKK